MNSKKFYSFMTMLFVAIALFVVAGCADKETSTEDNTAEDTNSPTANSEDSTTQYPIVIKAK